MSLEKPTSATTSPLALARAYLAEEPDADMRAELEPLVAHASAGDADAKNALSDRFRGPLVFGTAGLRGEVGAGLFRMNRVTVAKAAHGLGQALLEDPALDVKARGVVIGFDARRLSRRFAEDSAQILCALGIPVHLFPFIVPTPQLAFSVIDKHAAAGVMVTASHNPPRDNGYKVYWGNGAQIVPPIDAKIAAHIARAPRFVDMPRQNPFDAIAQGHLTVLGEAEIDAYHAAIAAQLVVPNGLSGERALRIVHTAMHGVGHRSVQRALAAASFPFLHAVPEQTEPDGAFPTVAFPNPEEPGALDRAFALADDVDADCVLANDPDADRLAVGVRNRAGDGWVRLSGNDVGFLLGDFLVSNTTGERVVATTLVSSSTLSRIAAHHNVTCLETLTGFKWIANGALSAEAAGDAHFIFGYEEALGYACGPRVRDKDGVSASVQMALVLEALRRTGRTVWDALDEIALTYGCSADTSWSVKKPGPQGQAALAAIMKAFRSDPPTSLDGSKVVRTRDLLRATDTDGPGGGLKRDFGAKADVLTFWTEAGVRLTVRPSGTEPKVKFYIDVSQKTDTSATLPETERALDAVIAAVKDEVQARASD